MNDVKELLEQQLRVAKESLALSHKQRKILKITIVLQVVFVALVLVGIFI